MREAFGQCSLWLAQDRTKRLQVRVEQHTYQLQFFAGNELQGCTQITPEQFRAVLHDYLHFESDLVSLTYDARHVVVRIKGQRWGHIADIDLMKLENMALNGESASVDAEAQY